MNYHVSNYLQQMPTVRVALILLLATLLSVLITSGARADGRTKLDGYWQHPDDPVWIEVSVTVCLSNERYVWSRPGCDRL